MEERPGRLWPLWLYPALCVAGVAALALALALSAPEERDRTGLGTSWVMAFALATLPGYAAAVGLLRERLARLPLRRVTLAAVVAAAGTPLVFVLLVMLASRARSDALAVAALLVAPTSGVALGYIAARARLRSGPRAV